jgi:hypothetical protein
MITESSKNNLKGKWNWLEFGGPQTSEQTKQKRVIQFSGNALKTSYNGTLFELKNFLSRPNFPHFEVTGN